MPRKRKRNNNLNNLNSLEELRNWGDADTERGDSSRPHHVNVKKIKPRKFDWKRKSHYQFNDIGFIAQEVEKIFPELVSKNNNDILHLSYEKLTPILVKTLQSQLNAIESIKKRIEKLEK